MYIVIEYIYGCDDNINIMCKNDDSGETAVFDTYKEAEQCAVKYCSWNYKIVKL